jgi:hypothetical protein
MSERDALLCSGSRAWSCWARPNYRNFDADGNEIPPSGGTPTDTRLPRVVPLPPQRVHATEVAADAPHGPEIPLGRVTSDVSVFDPPGSVTVPASPNRTG